MCRPWPWSDRVPDQGRPWSRTDRRPSRPRAARRGRRSLRSSARRLQTGFPLSRAWSPVRPGPARSRDRGMGPSVAGERPEHGDPGDGSSGFGTCPPILRRRTLVHRGRVLGRLGGARRTGPARRAGAMRLRPGGRRDRSFRATDRARVSKVDRGASTRPSWASGRTRNETRDMASRAWAPTRGWGYRFVPRGAFEARRRPPSEPGGRQCPGRVGVASAVGPAAGARRWPPWGRGLRSHRWADGSLDQPWSQGAGETAGVPRAVISRMAGLCPALRL